MKSFKSLRKELVDEEYLEEKNKPTSPEKWAQAKAAAKSKFAVYPSAYANAWASKKYKSMGGGWRATKEEVEIDENHIAIAMGKMLDDEGSMVLNQLDDIDRCSKMIRDYVGTDYEKQLPAWVQSKVTLAADYINTVGTYLASKNEDVKEEVVSESMPSGVIKIKQKYADMSAKEFAQNHGHKKDDELRSMALRHGYGKNSNYYVNKKREGQDTSKQVQEDAVDVELDEVAAWQRKEGKNPAGGLNKKGIMSYRREHPGSKLSLAVTTKPSKLKPGSKAANRRKSFCARMSGMKKRLTSAKTAHDPNSRINKSLRKWNC